MRVGVVGAGPAGLYLAALLRRDDPSTEVTVVERNPPDATYGWGVVFSEETLTELRDADYETFMRLDDRLVRWSAIDIRYRGATIRSRGHGFSAIRRTTLLAVLQERARELGAELVFEDEVDSLERFADHDVIAGADGVNSTVRASRPEAFGTRVHEHGSIFVWFGTDLVFDVFTFIFHETGHGLFTVHAYPFDSTTSTFIVETTPETWRAAGLDEMSEEESLAYCEDLFAEHLDGHRLLSNRSLWTRFRTVRNRHWSDGNLVLVGDAAYTAHFSIGSGTKLAIEDAIALAKGFRAHDRLEDVFAAYELDRRLPGERFQEAAIDSARYFETVSRYLGMAPQQFAVNLLTRSGRITHSDLERRDPALVSWADRWFAERAVDDPAGESRIIAPPPVLTPLVLAERTIANRLVLVAPPLDAAEDGRVGAPHQGQLAGCVDAGAGLIITEPIAISAHGRISLGTPGLYEDGHVDAWREVLDRSRGGTGAAIAGRITHAGPRGATRPRRHGVDRPLRRGSWPLLAPSPLPYTPRSQTPEDLFDRADDVRDDFAEAARLAAQAGFDAIVVDLSEGYLLAAQISPLTNRRDDEHGGALEARLRWPLEVIRAVREVWPGDRPLGVRLNVDDRRSGGLELTDGLEIVRTLLGEGVGLVDVAAGHTVPDGRGAPDYRRGYLVDHAATVRNETGATTCVGGAITTLDEANTILAAGRADLVVVDPWRYRDPIRRGSP